MRIHSWFVTLGIVGVSAAAAGVGCSSSSSGSTPPVGDDASTTDAASTEDTGAPADTGTGTDGATIVSEAGDGGLVCDVPAGTDACDTCALTSCCGEETTCQSEPANDAGSTDCADIFSCVQDCLTPPADSGVDGGTIDDCTTTCSAGHTTQGMTDFTALSSCLVTNCSTQCQ
jgi:hypothetical protein